MRAACKGTERALWTWDLWSSLYTGRERRGAEGNILEAIVIHDPAGFPDDAEHEMGVLQLLVLCPLNQLGWGPFWLFGHVCSGAIAQGPRSFCSWMLLGRAKCQAS